ncbi:hypothetical protein C4D60_Mb10t14740 [Musa balbisiana]|uniref:60S ribosomal protein L18a-like protein n=1 Tax=Musa balbisiana TaxID=52838 RepID=A0A4S8IX44_MUSBA|nr:hypothetical protein C4D60_Mb10t14740 [Musa balbisiana]
MSEESKDKPQCSTFHGAYDHAQPASIGFPLPVPPPGLTIAHSPSPASPAGLTAAQPPFPAPPQQPLPPSYAHDYQAAPGYAHAVEGRPETLPSLPCCGLGIGWVLFIIGFFLAAIPWYVGVFFLLCGTVDHREKPGLVACTIAAALSAIAAIIGGATS